MLEKDEKKPVAETLNTPPIIVKAGIGTDTDVSDSSASSAQFHSIKEFRR